jgi:hypothetical protein
MVISLGAPARLANLSGAPPSRKSKAPAAARTAARAKNHRLAGERFTPLYINPFSTAISFTTIGSAIGMELDRRQAAVSRIARKADL